MKEKCNLARSYWAYFENLPWTRKSNVLLRQGSENSFFNEQERARITLNSIGDAVLTTDLSGWVTYLNPAAEAVTGWSCQDALQQPLAAVFHLIDSGTRRIFANPIERAICEDRTVKLPLNYILIRRDGVELAIEDSIAPMRDYKGRVVGAVIVFRDVTESRAAALRMTHLAQHDFLTGLPNRMLLMERLVRAIEVAKRLKRQVGVLFLDIDNFKHVNDSLGHAVGDQLLQCVARRLVACVRNSDTVCRRGGDEFVVLLAEIETPVDAARTAEKLTHAFADPHFIADQELYVTLSIGISLYPETDMEANTVTQIADATLQNADTAMYHAKTTGPNNYQFYRPAMNIRATRRLILQSSLRRALKHNEFFLEYQPQVSLDSGTIVGAEALIRWQDPELGVIYPEQFIATAEDCGLIVPIGQWVLREACRQMRVWLDEGLAVVPVSINISATELRNREFAGGLCACLRDFDLAARYLQLELTESVLMRDINISAVILDSLKILGVQIAIDDFGTGYSSLGYLRRLPISTLKIDQCFVQDIQHQEDDRSIVGAIIGMGKSLRLRVIAEGVATTQQLESLQALHCEIGQGSLFSGPLAADQFSSLLGGPDGSALMLPADKARSTAASNSRVVTN